MPFRRCPSSSSTCMYSDSSTDEPQPATPPWWLAQDGDRRDNAGEGPVLLVGDAAGLVNPMQGEGISQAMSSGRAAAEAILGGPGHAAESYRPRLAAEHLPYQRIAAAAQAALVGRPRAVAVVARLLTAVAGGGRCQPEDGPSFGTSCWMVLRSAAAARSQVPSLG